MLKLYQKLDESIGNPFNSGDEEIRSWFLVKQNLLPFVICGLYVLVVTKIGPAFMKNRQPWTLRKAMILFNLFLVVAYSVSLFMIFTNLPYLGFKAFCLGTKVKKYDIAYTLTSYCWFLYILKYIELIDTIFFILRKKNHLITTLHVVHHTTVPIIGWVLLRTETSGLQSTPVLLNGVVHIIMYSYYGLSAIGPHMKKYLWWKNYLTILQMIQFVMILLFVVVVAPITGCRIMKSSIWMNILGAGIFLKFFYNFYANTFDMKAKNV